MTPGQRRFFWLCIFAMTFIFYYEARGVSLMGHGSDRMGWDDSVTSGHFSEQALFGTFVLVIGIVLQIIFERQRKQSGREAPYHVVDWIALSIGVGALAGILFQSYQTVSG